METVLNPPESESEESHEEHESTSSASDIEKTDTPPETRPQVSKNKDQDEPTDNQAHDDESSSSSSDERHCSNHRYKERVFHNQNIQKQLCAFYDYLVLPDAGYNKEQNRM